MDRTSTLAALRKAKGMTQESLATASGIKLCTLQKIEIGSSSMLRVQVGTVLQLARALGTTVEELVGQDLKQLYDGD